MELGEWAFDRWKESPEFDFGLPVVGQVLAVSRCSHDPDQLSRAVQLGVSEGSWFALSHGERLPVAPGGDRGGLKLGHSVLR